MMVNIGFSNLWLVGLMMVNNGFSNFWLVVTGTMEF